MRYYGGFTHVDLAHLAKPECWMPRKQKEESTLSEKETGEEVSIIALANKKTQTEAGHSEPQQNALI